MRPGKSIGRPNRISAYRINGKETLCQVIRKIHNLSQDEEARTLCGDALDMAQRMDARLRWYKEREDRGK